MSPAELIQIFREQDKNVLADILHTQGKDTIQHYSQKLWMYTSKLPFEQVLKNAFIKEFTRLDIPANSHQAIIDSLEKYRSIQTGPHIGFHDSNRLLTAHTVALASLPEDAYYVVATFSGIPFGNDSYPGALSWSKQHSFEKVLLDEKLIREAYIKHSDRERDLGIESQYRLTLYPARDRDMLVYRSTVTEQYTTYQKALTPQLKTFFPSTESGASFTKTMLQSYQALLQNTFPGKKIIALDVNEVISNYMQEVLNDTNHFIYKMFFHKETHELMLKHFSTSEHFFYDVHRVGTKEKSVHTYIEQFLLKSSVRSEDITSEKLQHLLQDTKLCPGIFLGFTILAFMNGFQCFGSFKQIHYLSDYKHKWLELNVLKHDITHIKTDSLTTGGVSDEAMRTLTAIDIALGTKWVCNIQQTLEEILLPIESVLRAFKK
jgi:hypothetical protein